MKKYYKTISNHLLSLVEVAQRKETTGFNSIVPQSSKAATVGRSTSSPKIKNELDSSDDIKPYTEPHFYEQLLEATDKRADQNYSPQGESHERVSPAGSYLLSQTREYLVYTPAGYSVDEALPLLMVLHGCKQTHLDIRADTGFDEIADRERFIVVYPYVTRYLGVRNLNCWGWWLRHHIRSGSGEVEDLRRIIDRVKQEFTIDDLRVHIAGLSSGAGMSVAALVAHGTMFASGASVAGVAYGESARAVRVNSFISVKYHSLKKTVSKMKAQLAGKGKLAPLLIVQSHKDKMVEFQAAMNLRDSWLALKRAKKQRPDPLEGKTQDIDWQYRQFPRGKGPTPVETLLVDKVKHGWIGGNEGKFSESRGPNISEVIWLFFKRHPR